MNTHESLQFKIHCFQNNKAIFLRLRLIKSRQLQSRSSRPEMLCKKGALRSFTKFTVKNLYQSLFFNKVAGLRPADLLKRDSGTGVFLWTLWNFSENFFIEHFWWMVLYNSTPFVGTARKFNHYMVYLHGLETKSCKDNCRTQKTVLRHQKNTTKCSAKKVFLKISQKLQQSTSARVSFFKKLQASDLEIYLNKTLAQVFSGNIETFLTSTFS